MDQQKARKIVCEAGIKLVKEGLVARTWGNISQRVDSKGFVITPSGRNYEDLTEKDIVYVSIEDCEYEGDIKPSSEKGLHAAIYKARPDVNAIAHTHQINASTVAAARKDVTDIDSSYADILGSKIKVAAYGLPGTGKLAKATSEALGTSNAALMANHGAVCTGSDMDEAFIVATTLEAACEDYIARSFMKMLKSDEKPTTAQMHAYYLESIGQR